MLFGIATRQNGGNSAQILKHYEPLLADRWIDWRSYNAHSGTSSVSRNIQGDFNIQG